MGWRTIHTPQSVEDLTELIASAAAHGDRLELRGGGTKADMGVPCDNALVDMRGFAGIIDYDPAELVLSVNAGTPLAEVEALLLEHNQMLAFEPFDHGPVFNKAAGNATIGGVVAAGVAGSRRLSRGGTRDHLLGFKAVSGRGEAFVGGAKVTKNVTGYDLPKLACGSWGRLFALTELNLKTLPRSEVSVTLALDGLAPRAAIHAMSLALGSQASVSAAAHQPRGGTQGQAVTALRLGGFGPSVIARRAILAERLNEVGAIRMMEASEADIFWRDFKTAEPLPDALPLWRVIVPPRHAPTVIDTLVPLGATWIMDWAGGLLWVSCDAVAVRDAAAAVGGHAQLLRAPEALRRTVACLHPQPRGIAALETKVRRAFDPAGVFETARFLDS